MPPTVLFRDDFDDNSIDPAKWTTSGTVVVEAGGVMQVLQNMTDQGGVLSSVAIPVRPTGVLTLRRRAFVHYAGFVSSPMLVFSIDTLPQFSTSYANNGYNDAAYIEDYGTRVSRNGARPNVRAQRPDVSDPIPAIWDEWFDERIEYNPSTGTLDYFISSRTSENVLHYDVGVPTGTSNLTMKVALNSWGWFTGQQHQMDNLEITQEN